MFKSLLIFAGSVIIFISGCGTPNEPESILGGDGGYKIINRFPTNGYAQDIIVEDSLAYVAQGEAGLAIINISNINSLLIVSEVNASTSGLNCYSYKVTKKDSVIFLAGRGFGVNTINVANPDSAKLEGRNLPIKPAYSFNLMGDFLFTAINEYGVNVSKIVDGLYLMTRVEFGTPGYAQGLCTSADNNYLFIACGETGLALYNISIFNDGYGPFHLIKLMDTPGYAEDVVTHPVFPVAFIACGTGGLVIADYSDTSNVKIIGSYDTGGYAKEVIYRDGKVYVTTELRGLQIFDVLDLTMPVRLSTVQTQFAIGVDVDDKYVYVTDKNEGLIIISRP
jgi:hypothetical protein